MRLTRLDILGFKSFGERTVLSFQPGITAIVGPNGCGKSNIADAILWCLGEQSPKTLRGDRMDDVLFNGNARRQPTGLAEVSLTLGGVQPGEIDGVSGQYREVTISRRLYRSGESEYLINRVPCRLKDVRDLLIESGAGIKGHTVLEQGKVGEIVTASPIERRALVEETAGITKYKLRKTEALRKLDSTEQNLLRVRDIIGEVRRQLNSLDRQVKKAERYRHTADQLRNLELYAAGDRYQELSSQSVSLTADLSRVRAESAAALAQLGTLDAATETLKAQIADLDHRLSQSRTELSVLETSARDAHHRTEVLATQIEEWRVRQGVLTDELTSLNESVAARRDERDRLAQEIAGLDEAIAERTGRVTDQEATANDLKARLARISTSIDQTRRHAFEAAAAATTATTALAAIAARREDLERRRIRYQGDITAVRSEIDHIGSAKRDLETSHDDHARALATKDADRGTLREVLATRQAALQEGEAALSGRRDDLLRLRATRESLHGLQRDLVGYDESVRKVLLPDTTGESVPGLLGVVADVLEIPAEYERAVDAVLSDRLQAVVAVDLEHIVDSLALLDGQNVGRAVFVPKIPRASGSSPEAPLEQREGIHGQAVHLIGCRPGYDALRDALLANVVFVENREVARRCWEADENGVTWVSTAGEVFHHAGVVCSGGTGSNTGLQLLERKRRIKLLDQEIVDAEAALVPIETDVASVRDAVNAGRAALDLLDQEVRDRELRVLHDRKAADALTQELTQLDRRLALLASEFEAVQTELDTMAHEVTAHESARVHANAETAKLNDELRAHLEQAEQTTAVLQAEESTLSELRLALAEDREKREHLSATIRAVTDRLQEAADQIRAKSDARSQLDERIVLAGLERGQILEQITALDQDVLTLRAHVERLTTERAESDHQARELDDRTRTARREADAAQERVHQITVSLTEITVGLRQLVADVMDRHQIDLERQTVDSLPPLSCEPDEVEQTIAALKDTLAQIGPVNLAAIEEYQELEDRSRFLATQETDLVQSVENLRAAIAKINATTKTLFVEAFNALNTRFGEVFAAFFEGGQAALHLVDEQNPLESGIEIVAQPPGKKLRHISLLSGGEKALTAIALLFASFLIHPSPFCVMDEIDAPLDEENVRRFTRALRPMTAHSQFLVVTHNRRTMEQADVLYGVTMEEAGVSKIVSVRLHQDAEPAKSVDVELATTEISI